MRRLMLFSMFIALSSALASDPGYELTLGTEMRGGTLTVAPVLTAPANKRLRYDVVVTRSGRSGNSDSRQGGNVTVGANGTAGLSQVSISVGEGDRYDVSVKVYDGARLVAEKTARQPD
jgi:hypothetical protein